MIRQRSVAGLVTISIAVAFFYVSFASAQTTQQAPQAIDIAPNGATSEDQTPGDSDDGPDIGTLDSLRAIQEEADRQAIDDADPPTGEQPNPATDSADTAESDADAPGAEQTAPDDARQSDDLATDKDWAPQNQPVSPGQGQQEESAEQITPQNHHEDTETAPGTTAEDKPNTPKPSAAEAAPAEPQVDPKHVNLKIATWAGAYGQSQERAFFRPFVERHGYSVEPVTYDGAYDALIDQSGEPKWSLVDLNGDAMVRACNEGRLERLDSGILEASPDGAPLTEDFLPGAIHPCGVASVAWSAVIVYNQDLTIKPASLEDFFDIGKIPGKRLLPKQPRYSLELALMADGIAPDQVYTVLQTAEGQNRAFAKLSSIKDDILWWEKPSEVIGRIAEKEAVMGLAFNGRAFMAIVAAKQPIELLWDRQIYSFDYWSIPRDAPFQQAAKTFIRFATSPAPLSDQARWIPYGPARRSALKLVGKHPELDFEMKPFLPTSEANFRRALAFDGSFWLANEAALQTRFTDWVEGRQLPVQKEAAIPPQAPISPRF